MVNIDDEPPSRSHRPFVAVGALALLFVVAATAILLTRHSAVGPGRSLAILLRLPTQNAKTHFAIDSVTVGGATYVIRGLQPQIMVPAAASLTVRGWAVDDAARSVGKGVTVFVDGRNPVQAEYGIRRDDVVKALGNADDAMCGFSATIDTAGLRKGQHELTFQVINHAGTANYPLPARVQFTVG